jgi:hypothetical protein
MERDSSKKRRSWRSKLIYPLFLIVVVLVAGEIVVRIMGYGPWQPSEQSFSVKPDGPFFQADSVLGYVGRPGQFDLTLGNEVEFTVTHDADGFRLTSYEQAADTLNRPEIWIFGCSFTHGFGVNDQDNYPWMIQEQFPQYKVRNYGMDGYSTLQSLYLLQRELKLKKAPELVILAYGAFHDQRNTSNRFWRKVLHGREVVKGLTYPQVRFNDQDSLVMGFSKLEYQPFPLMQYSALSHYLELGYNAREDAGLKSAVITQNLIMRFVETCRSVKVSVLLAGIYRHEGTGQMLSYFEGKGTSVLDISQDLEQEDLRIMPSDGHPNAKAHRKMANILGEWLRDMNSLTGF